MNTCLCTGSVAFTISERHALSTGTSRQPKSSSPCSLRMRDQARTGLIETFSLSEEQAGRVPLGSVGEVTLDAFPGRRFAGRVIQINPSANIQSRAFTVRVQLPNPGLVLKPGMFGRVIQACGARPALLLPREAVSRVGQLETVSVLEPDGASRQRHVRTGKSFGERVEVLSGLAAGEMVVLP